MKIGTRVRVVDSEKQYATYKEMFKIMGFKNPENGRNIRELQDYKDVCFVIFAKEKHLIFDFFVYGIKDAKGNQYLIDKEGLGKIKKTKKTKKEPIKEVKEKPFPKVMKSKDSTKVVYFTEESKGIVVVPDAFNKLYTFSDVWIMQYFEDTDEQITVTFN